MPTDALFWLSKLIVGIVNVAEPRPDTKTVAVMLGTKKVPNNGLFAISLVSAVDVIMNEAAENELAPRLPLAVPDNV